MDDGEAARIVAALVLAVTEQMDSRSELREHFIMRVCPWLDEWGREGPGVDPPTRHLSLVPPSNR